MLRDELAKRLSALRRNRIIADWHDRQIGAGENWAQAIEDNLKSAEIILLLVSPDFLHSEFCNEVELRRAMERHAAGEACVIPIILRPCYWQDEAFAALQALPKNAEPITSWSDQDKAFLDVEVGIRSAIDCLTQQADATKKLEQSEERYRTATPQKNKSEGAGNVVSPIKSDGIKDFPTHLYRSQGHTLKGLDVYIGDQKIGVVDDVLVNLYHRLYYLVIHTGAWIFVKKVMIPAEHAKKLITLLVAFMLRA